MDASSFPHAAQLQDRDAMQTVLQANLRTRDNEPLDIRGCTVDYVRLSIGRCVMQYNVAAMDPGTGQRTTLKVTGVIYSDGRTPEVLRRLTEDDPQAAIPIGPLALLPVTYVPELDLVLQVFPYDLRLPGLKTLLAENETVAAALRGESVGGDWRIDSWRSEVIRYRPDMRAMVRVEFRDRQPDADDAETRVAFAKVYRDPDDGAYAYRFQQAMWEETTRQDAGFVVARPRAYLEDLRVLLLDPVPGDRLLDVVRRADEARATDGMREAARAMAGLHQLALPEGLLSVVTDNRADRLGGAAASLSVIAPKYAKAIEEIVTTANADLRPPLAPTHHDLKLGHILLDEQVAVLDFDKMALGNPLLDVANLLATLTQEREGTAKRAHRRGGLARSFVEEYLGRVPASWGEQLPAHYALAALADAATTGRGQRGRSAIDSADSRIEGAVARAQQSLAGQLW